MFGKYEDSEPCFKILVRWNYQKDRQYQKLVESGERDPVANTSEEQGGWIWLKRGAYLHQAEVEILHAQWLSVLEHSLNPSSNSKSRVLDFINFVISSDTHRLFVQEKLEGYDRLNFKAKIKMLNHLLNHFYEEKNLDKEGSFHLKNYLDVLACHTLVIFPLLFWHLRAQEWKWSIPHQNSFKNEKQKQKKILKKFLEKILKKDKNMLKKDKKKENFKKQWKKCFSLPCK